MQYPCKSGVYPALGVTIQHMRNPAIGLLRSDMAELQDAWEAGQATRAEGWDLDPMHDATLYAALVLLGMYGLSELARVLSSGVPRHGGHIGLDLQASPD